MCGFNLSGGHYVQTGFCPSRRRSQWRFERLLDQVEYDQTATFGILERCSSYRTPVTRRCVYALERRVAYPRCAVDPYQRLYIDNCRSAARPSPPLQARLASVDLVGLGCSSPGQQSPCDSASRSIARFIRPSQSAVTRLDTVDVRPSARDFIVRGSHASADNSSSSNRRQHLDNLQVGQ